jgi:hypothetical protein
MKSFLSMTIPFQVWRRCGLIGQIVLVPSALYLFFHPDLGAWSFWLTAAAYTGLGLFGGSGALMAILLQKGVVRFSYTDADKKTSLYKVHMLSQDMQRAYDEAKERRERKEKE